MKKVIKFVENNKLFTMVFIACAALWTFDNWDAHNILSNIWSIVAAAFFFGGTYMMAFLSKAINKEKGEASELHLDSLCASLAWFCFCGIICNTMISLHNLQETIPVIPSTWGIWMALTPVGINLALTMLSAVARLVKKQNC